jgi:hypothetical protein
MRDSAWRAFGRRITQKDWNSVLTTSSCEVHEIRKRETLRKKAKKSNSSELLERFRDLRRKIKSEILKKKREYIQGLAESVRGNSKEIWRFINTNPTSLPYPDTMTHGDLLSPHRKQKLTHSIPTSHPCFDRIYTTISTSATDLPPVNNMDSVVLESIIISFEEICCLLSGLCTTRAMHWSLWDISDIVERIDRFRSRTRTSKTT